MPKQTAYKAFDICPGYVYYNQPFYNNPDFLDIGYGTSYGTHYGVLAQKLPTWARADEMWAEASPSNDVDTSISIRRYERGYGNFYGETYGAWRFFRIPHNHISQQPLVYFVEYNLFGIASPYYPIPVVHWTKNGVDANDDDISFVSKTQCPNPILLVREMSFHNDYVGIGIEVDE